MPAKKTFDMLYRMIGASADWRFQHQFANICVFSIIGVIVMFVYGVYHWLLGEREMAVFHWLYSLASAANMAHLIRTRKLPLAQNVILGMLLPFFWIIVLHGGIRATGVYWIGLYPVIAFFFKGKMEAVRWVLALLGGMLAMLALQAVGVVATPFTAEVLSILMVSVLICSMMMFSHEALRAKAESDLADRTIALDETNRSLLSEIHERAKVEAALRETEECMRHMAHHDALTGLPNRALFYEHLNRAISLARRNSSKFALLFIDLDGFKPINDTLGHRTGDLLLCAVAQRLIGNFRASDLIARIGGDEFIVLVADVEDEEMARALAEAAAAKLTVPYQENGKNCNIGASIGVSIYPDHGTDPDALMAFADSRMYEIKAINKANAFLQ